MSVEGDLGFASPACFVAHNAGNKPNEQFQVQGWTRVPTALDSPHIPPASLWLWLGTEQVKVYDLLGSYDLLSFPEIGRLML